jgi:transposase
VSDLFGTKGRELLASLAIPEPWATTLATSLRFVDELDAEIAACERDLRAGGADHPYVLLLMTAPGIAWVLGYTIAAELGDIGRFASPKKLAGYTGLCPLVRQSGRRDDRGPLVRQSGRRDDRGPLAKNGPKYLRWALIEAATHAARHPAYRDRYEHTKRRLGRQRGSKVARVEIARELATAIWHMLSKNEPFAPGRPPVNALVA